MKDYIDKIFADETSMPDESMAMSEADELGFMPGEQMLPSAAGGLECMPEGEMGSVIDNEMWSGYTKQDTLMVLN